MADLLISDSDRDALVAAGLLLGTLTDAVTFRVVASLPEANRLLHDARRIYTRVMICGVPAADSGSLRSALTVFQARGTRVWWFDSHEFLWTTDVRSQLDQLDVQYHLPDGYRPETERTSGLVLTHLLESGDARAESHERSLRRALSEVRASDFGGPDWVTLVDAVVHDHRLVSNRAIRAALSRVWEPDGALQPQEARLVALQRSREERVSRFLERLSDERPTDQELLTFDAEQYKGLRFIRPRMYTEAARRSLRSEYAQARVERGWVFAARDAHRTGLDLQVAFLDKLFDLDVGVHGYPYRVNVRVESGADLDERLVGVLETSLEEERTGKNKRPSYSSAEEEFDW